MSTNTYDQLREARASDWVAQVKYFTGRTQPESTESSANVGLANTGLPTTWGIRPQFAFHVCARPLFPFTCQATTSPIRKALVINRFLVGFTGDDFPMEAGRGCGCARWPDKLIPINGGGPKSNRPPYKGAIIDLRRGRTLQRFTEKEPNQKKKRYSERLPCTQARANTS